MKQLESPTDWLEARKVKTREKGETRPPNVFRGDSRTEVSEVQGVKVFRIKAWPEGDAKAPNSYACADPGSGLENDGDRTAAYAWRLISASEPLPLNFEWQQSSESRWNCFFALPDGAKCLGLGQRLSGFNLRGRAHTLFNYSDSLHIPTLDTMYMSIPFLIVRHQEQYYGIFLDSPARQRWSLDVELDGNASIELLSRRGWTVYMFAESSLPDLLAAYTSLTGRSDLPPTWALGHQQSRWSYPDARTVLDVARQFRSRQIPCDTIVLDIDYMDEYRVFTHSPERFPDFKETVDQLAAENFRVVAIVNPCVKKDAKYYVYQDGRKSDYFCKKADDKPFYAKVWPGQCVFPDYLRQDVRLWWAAFHGFYTENNVAGIWNDMNEPCLIGQACPLPLEAIELPKENHQLFMQQSEEGLVGHFEVRNLYGHQMTRATYEGLKALKPDERPFVLSRSGYAGTQRFAAVWMGENMSWWEHLAVSIPMLLNVGLSGVPFCGVDIGGFGDDCSPELLARWYALGIFYPFMRNHCSKEGSPQEPWAFGSEVEEYIRHFIKTRYQLLPYIRNLFWEHVRNGAPLMRPLIWAYPQDSFAAEVDDQFLFGSDILVAPVVKRGQSARSVYLPEGRWYPFEGGEPMEGGKVHTVTFGLGQVPAFVREGAVIPLADPMQSTSQYEHVPVTFKCYGENAIGLYVEDDGVSYEYQEDGYNEWLLRLENNNFSAEVVNFEYIAPDRAYFVKFGSEKRSIKLPGQFE